LGSDTPEQDARPSIGLTVPRRWLVDAGDFVAVAAQLCGQDVNPIGLDVPAASLRIPRSSRSGDGLLDRRDDGGVIAEPDAVYRQPSADGLMMTAVMVRPAGCIGCRVRRHA
jgi:hypothetical protein